MFQYYVLTRLFVIWEKRNNLARPVLLSLYMNAYPSKYKYLLLTREEQQGEAGILQSNFTVEKQQIPFVNINLKEKSSLYITKPS